jgi:hypothetical protein
MNRVKIAALFLASSLLFFMPGNMRAQGLTVDAEVTQFEVISLQSLDFTQAPNWFWLTMTNTLGQPVRVVFIVTLFKDGERLAEAETGPYTVPVTQPGDPHIIQGANFGTTINVASSEIFEPGEEITDAILGRGILPTGIYRFLILAQAVDLANVRTEDDVIIEITNPTSGIELVAPGLPAQDFDPADWPTFYSNIITFVWFTTAQNVTLQVVEARDLGNFESNFEQQPDIQAEFFNGISTFTTQSGTSNNPCPEPVGQTPCFDIIRYIALSPGKYLWRVVANVLTTGGTEQFFGEMMGFQIAGTASVLGGTSSERIMTILEGLLGEPRVQELFGPGGPLNGASLEDLRLGDQQITVEDLNRILQDFLDGKKRVVEDIVQ